MKISTEKKKAKKKNTLINDIDLYGVGASQHSID